MSDEVTTIDDSISVSPLYWASHQLSDVPLLSVWREMGDSAILIPRLWGYTPRTPAPDVMDGLLNNSTTVA